MLNIGSRSNPSVLNLVLIVIVIIAVANYVLISLDTENWVGFLNRFADSPNAVIVHCYGKTMKLDRGSDHFSALAEIMHEIMSGQRHSELLSMSPETYQENWQSPGMVAIEFFYPTALSMNNGNKYNSSLDSLVISLEGLNGQGYVVFGRNQGVPASGTLQVDSTQRLKEYLRSQSICPPSASSQ